MWPLMNLVSNLEFVLIAAFGALFAVRGYILVGVISAFIVYAKQFSRPVNDLAQIYGQIQTAIAGAERVFAVLNEPDEPTEGVGFAESGEANISFSSVNFAYLPERPVIKGFSLNIAPGKKVALVGSTGSGKTTIANLLLRFYDADSGVISINGQDITAISRAELRHKVSVVLQDTALFTDTVRNNLKYASDTADDEKLLHALEMSHCRELVEKLPEGLDTVLTGAGASLSQGQRQLFAIARAFVADSEILILDEAMSNVDTRTEKEIQDAMQRVMHNRTSLVIAHRLSTIRDSDLIIVMDDGQIVESGSHTDLFSRRGKYYELYMTQYAGGKYKPTPSLVARFASIGGFLCSRSLPPLHTFAYYMQLFTGKRILHPAIIHPFDEYIHFWWFLYNTCRFCCIISVVCVNLQLRARDV